MFKRFFFSASVASLLLFSGHSSVAQDAWPNYAPSNMNVIMSTHISNLSLQRVIDRQYNSKSTKVNRSKSPKGVAVKSSPQSHTRSSTRSSTATRNISTAYRTNPAVSARVQKQFIAWARTQNRREAASIEKVFKQYNPVQVWQGIVRSYGLRVGDMADSLASYWILNYTIANGGKPTTRAQALAVRNQVRALLVSDTYLAKFSPAQKQELSEVWMINFLVQHGAYGTAVRRNDQALLQKLGAAATTRFKRELRVNLRQISLTNNGFVPRR